MAVTPAPELINNAVCPNSNCKFNNISGREKSEKCGTALSVTKIERTFNSHQVEHSPFFHRCIAILICSRHHMTANLEREYTRL